MFQLIGTIFLMLLVAEIIFRVFAKWSPWRWFRTSCREIFRELSKEQDDTNIVDKGEEKNGE